MGSRQGWRCAGGRSLLKPGMELDHRLPHAMVGDHEADAFQNLQCLCPECHALKTKYDKNFIAAYKRAVASARRHGHCSVCPHCLATVHNTFMGRHRRVCRVPADHWAPSLYVLAPRGMQLASQGCLEQARQERHAARQQLLEEHEDEAAWPAPLR